MGRQSMALSSFSELPNGILEDNSQNVILQRSVLPNQFLNFDLYDLE